MGDSNPCIGNAGEDKFSILFKAHTDPPSLTVIFDGIGEKVVEELVEFIFNPEIYQVPGGSSASSRI